MMRSGETIFQRGIETYQVYLFLGVPCAGSKIFWKMKASQTVKPGHQPCNDRILSALLEGFEGGYAGSIPLVEVRVISLDILKRNGFPYRLDYRGDISCFFHS